MTNKMIDNRVKKIQALEDQIRELQDQADKLKDELKEEMTERNTEEMQTDKFIVRWKNVISNRLDSKKLKAELPDIYKAFTKTSSSRRFTIA